MILSQVLGLPDGTWRAHKTAYRGREGQFLLQQLSVAVQRGNALTIGDNGSLFKKRQFFSCKTPIVDKYLVS